MNTISNTPDITLLYVMDPHCGWCFGFGKVIEQLYHHYKNNESVQFEVLAGGLFVPKIPASKAFADEKRPIIKRIEEMSGVKFSEDYIANVLGGNDFVDSEVPCRVLNTANALNPKQIIPFMEDLLKEQFGNAKNLSHFENAVSTIEKYGMNAQDFRAAFDSESIKKLTLDNFEKAHQIVTGYPVLFARDSNGNLQKLAGGYAPFDRLKNKIDAFLENQSS
jgi:putative protein-disulfide isomerase